MRHFWLRVFFYAVIFLLGRWANLEMVRLHGGIMPCEFPWGDWIPCLGYVASVGDFMQLFGIAAIILAALVRFFDERYVTR